MNDSTGFSAVKIKVGQTKKTDVKKYIYLITTENVPCRNIYVSLKNKSSVLWGIDYSRLHEIFPFSGGFSPHLSLHILSLTGLWENKTVINVSLIIFHWIRLRGD